MPRPRVRLGQIDLLTKRVRAVDYKRSASEFAICCTLADVLKRWLKPGWRFSHFPAGELRDDATGARLKRMGLMPGWPDYILFAPKGGGPRFLEMKRAKYNYLTDEQSEFQTWALEQGYGYAVARGLDEALLIVRGWGALRV